MANQEHLDLLKQGNAVWNEWRSKNPALLPDLTLASLIDAHLMRAKLTNANLSVAVLSGVNVYGVNFSGADLSKANLSGANLTETDLRDADLDGTQLIRTNICHADLTGSKYLWNFRLGRESRFRYTTGKSNYYSSRRASYHSRQHQSCSIHLPAPQKRRDT